MLQYYLFQCLGYVTTLDQNYIQSSQANIFAIKVLKLSHLLYILEVNFLEQSKCSLKDQTHDLKAVLDSNIPLLKRGLYCYILLAEINTFVILFWGINYDNR